MGGKTIQKDSYTSRITDTRLNGRQMDRQTGNKLNSRIDRISGRQVGQTDSTNDNFIHVRGYMQNDTLVILRQ